MIVLFPCAAADWSREGALAVETHRATGVQDTAYNSKLGCELTTAVFLLWTFSKPGPGIGSRRGSDEPFV